MHNQLMHGPCGTVLYCNPFVHITTVYRNPFASLRESLKTKKLKQPSCIKHTVHFPEYGNGVLLGSKENSKIVDREQLITHVDYSFMVGRLYRCGLIVGPIFLNV